MALRLKDQNSIAIGPAELRIGDYATNVGTITPVLTSDRNFAYSEKTSVVYQVGYNDKQSVKYNYPVDITTSTIGATIQSETVELSKDILALVFGLDPDDITTSIDLGTITDTDYRLEILYTYPDTTKTLTFVFPKVRIVRGLNIVLTGDAEVSCPLEIRVLPVNVSPWASFPFGKIYIGGF